MPFVFLGVGSHDALSGVSTADHHTATVAGDLNLADLLEKNHASLESLTASDHHGLAGQAAMEAEQNDNSMVRPGFVQFHPRVVKTSCHYETVTTTTIVAQVNVASVTDNGTGDTTIVFDVDFSAAIYITTFSAAVTGTSVIQVPAAGSIPVITFSDLGVTAVDSSQCGIMIVGDFA